MPSKKHIFANRTTSTQWNFMFVAFHFWKVQVSFMISFSELEHHQFWFLGANMIQAPEPFKELGEICKQELLQLRAPSSNIYIMSSGQLSFQKVEHTVHTHTHTDDHFEKHSLPSTQLQKTCMNASKRRSIALQKEYSTYSLQISSIP